MISAEPLVAALRRKLGAPPPDITSRALDSWEIAPGADIEVPPAIALPGTEARITATVFADRDMVLRAFRGYPAEWHGPTLGHRLRAVTLYDGRLSSRGAERHLRARSRLPVRGRLPELGSAAMYETWVGNRWFGNWLVDNCLTYGLAQDSGLPVCASAPSKPPHGPAYESLLGMAPRIAPEGHFDELVIFDDLPDNPGKRARAAAMRSRLLETLPPVHPGPRVFLLRGHHGDRRLLENEMALAETLAARGFHILDPMNEPVATVLHACAGAPVVAGVEGSQLTHALVSQAPGAALLVIQPADRTTAALKTLGERFGLRFAYVVAEGADGAYRVDAGDVLRTLDLLA
ncbi:glycosyltransferase 61 family protein [Neotabrizicola shimadae]|uniref:Glycosyltransferase family 61 protein n=1 Tax=Neotabrizicola shimadae TaxID=2807096 RepID=A0A8G0ZR77_9RHOB|nr:glycosyltransferase family 61 protein [Neotabrizicola shimadae]QYZ68613.1 glycosyltransferase family 61 protein [Neotabrizicola shimadae]